VRSSATSTSGPPALDHLRVHIGVESRTTTRPPPRLVHEAAKASSSHPSTQVSADRPLCQRWVRRRGRGPASPAPRRSGHPPDRARTDHAAVRVRGPVTALGADGRPAAGQRVHHQHPSRPSQVQRKNTGPRYSGRCRVDVGRREQHVRPPRHRGTAALRDGARPSRAARGQQRHPAARAASSLARDHDDTAATGSASGFRTRPELAPLDDRPEAGPGVGRAVPSGPERPGPSGSWSTGARRHRARPEGGRDGAAAEDPGLDRQHEQADPRARRSVSAWFARRRRQRGARGRSRGPLPRRVGSPGRASRRRPPLPAQQRETTRTTPPGAGMRVRRVADGPHDGAQGEPAPATRRERQRRPEPPHDRAPSPRSRRRPAAPRAGSSGMPACRRRQDDATPASRIT